MKKRIFGLVIIFAMVLTVFSSSALAALSAGDVTTEAITVTLRYDLAQTVLTYVNQHRTNPTILDDELSPYPGRVYPTVSAISMDSVLQDAAMLRAAELVKAYNADHSRPNGSPCFTAIEGGWRTIVGENIAMGQSSAESVMNSQFGWMYSDGHRDNIMNGSFKSIGVGCIEYNSTLYWVQLFDGGTPRTTSKSGTESVTYNIMTKGGHLVHYKDANEQDLPRIIEVNVGETVKIYARNFSYVYNVSAGGSVRTESQGCGNLAYSYYYPKPPVSVAFGYDYLWFTGQSAGGGTLFIGPKNLSTDYRLPFQVIVVDPNAPQVQFGDVNQDGKIDLADSLMICNYIAGRVTLTGTQLLAADVNGDGSVKLDDSLLICNYIAGRFEKFPAEG